MIETFAKRSAGYDELNEGGVSLSNFSLDDFRLDLLNFMEVNRKKSEAAPLGIYALGSHKLESLLFNPDSLIID